MKNWGIIVLGLFHFQFVLMFCQEIPPIVLLGNQKSVISVEGKFLNAGSYFSSEGAEVNVFRPLNREAEILQSISLHTYLLRYKELFLKDSSLGISPYISHASADIQQSTYIGGILDKSQSASYSSVEEVGVRVEKQLRSKMLRHLVYVDASVSVADSSSFLPVVPTGNVAISCGAKTYFVRPSFVGVLGFEWRNRTSVLRNELRLISQIHIPSIENVNIFLQSEYNHSLGADDARVEFNPMLLPPAESFLSLGFGCTVQAFSRVLLHGTYSLRLMGKQTWMSNTVSLLVQYSL